MGTHWEQLLLVDALNLHLCPCSLVEELEKELESEVTDVVGETKREKPCKRYMLMSITSLITPH